MEAKDFMKFKNWAVAGDVMNQQKYAHKIVNALNSNGYQVEGVHPKEEHESVHNSIMDIEHTIDVLDLCINPKSGINIVKEANKKGINKVLIQPGAESSEILEYCRENNMTAIQGCVLVELRKL
ncbi:CoA-binding protein [Oceanirhabdus sp. W0125-5]|uniref:CoA-binding protein n=1 Tax=Oceanirhabdus sp. W0125-5 TaxID=2999116 RepID=UPI0022F2B628|nr:CoA-binding protein [Oceanirhabdus sp. W0125-5]WBW99549.1 CoA-binding protein [Oceanirhabdus sp. W0125-5]